MKAGIHSDVVPYLANEAVGPVLASLNFALNMNNMTQCHYVESSCFGFFGFPSTTRSRPHLLKHLICCLDKLLCYVMAEYVSSCILMFVLQFKQQRAV